jgi:hypothetical protein
MGQNAASEDEEQPIQAKLLTETSQAPLQRQPETEEEETEPIQAKSAGALRESFEAGAAVETQVSQSKGHGSPLPDAVRTYMEPRFGVDFRDVRVHTGSEARQMNRAVGAQAFTHGTDIYFGAGSSPTNLALTAHELTHVVQQTGGAQILTRDTASTVQREEPGEGQGSEAPLPAAENATMPGAVPAGDTPEASGTQKKTVDLTLTAIYEDVPGAAKDKVKRAKGNEAVWLDPLTMFSNYPKEKRSSTSYGVVAGGGQKTVDTFKAPVSESAQPSGRGSVSTELKYAGDQNKSFSVTVTGIKKNLIAGAEAAARKTIEREIMAFGDIDEIIATAEQELHADERYQDAKVAISVRDAKVMDAGRTTFYYKVRNNAGIQMDLQVAPVGEKQTKYTGSKTSGTSTEDEEAKKTRILQESEGIKKDEEETYKKTDTSTETRDDDYNESVVKTLDDYVSKAKTVHNEFASELSGKVTSHREAKWGDKEEFHRKAQDYTDYTKDSKHTVESGERNKSNLAAKLQKGVKIAKKVTSIPYIDKIPVLGWLTRRVKGWQLDLLDMGLGLFAEEGKVNFTDTKLDETVKSHQDIKDDTERKRDIELKEDDKTEVTRKLTEDFKSKTREDWERHLKDLTEIRKSYSSKIKKDSETKIDKDYTGDYKRETKKEEAETEKRHRELANQTTTATFEVATTWKFTKPVVKASVTSGDAEVSYAPFPPEADELANTK